MTDKDMLLNVPHMITFMDRALIFAEVIRRGKHEEGYHGHIQVTVRRENIFADSFMAIYP